MLQMRRTSTATAQFWPGGQYSGASSSEPRRPRLCRVQRLTSFCCRHARSDRSSSQRSPFRPLHLRVCCGSHLTHAEFPVARSPRVALRCESTRAQLCLLWPAGRLRAHGGQADAGARAPLRAATPPLVRSTCMVRGTSAASLGSDDARSHVVSCDSRGDVRYLERRFERRGPSRPPPSFFGAPSLTDASTHNATVAVCPGVLLVPSRSSCTYSYKNDANTKTVQTASAARVCSAVAVAARRERRRMRCRARALAVDCCDCQHAGGHSTVA